MGYSIRMGIPEMKELWDDLQQKYRSGTVNKKDERIYKKWVCYRSSKSLSE